MKKTIAILEGDNIGPEIVRKAIKFLQVVAEKFHHELWTYAGCWTGAGTGAPVQWLGGYQPGIISKDTGATSFWFTISGQNQAPRSSTACNMVVSS